MENGVLTATVNGTTQSVDVLASDPAWAQQTFYFKAGAYCLDNTGLANEGAKARFFQLSAQHQITCLITNVTVNAGQCCLTWSSQLGRAYFLEGKKFPGDTNWFTLSPMLTAASNLTSFCMPLSSPYRFFRVGMVVP